MMAARHFELAEALHDPIDCRAGFQSHRVTGRRGVFFSPVGQRTGSLRAKVLDEGAAQGHVHDLHPVADRQDGLSRLSGFSEQSQVEFRSLVGREGDGGSDFLAEKGRVDIRSPVKTRPSNIARAASRKDEFGRGGK